jgi:hypothetical protein
MIIGGGGVKYLFLDLADGLKVGGAVEDVAAEEEELDEVAGHITAGHVESAGQVGQREALVDGDDVRHTVTRVHDHARQQTLGVEGQHGLRDEAVKRLVVHLALHVAMARVKSREEECSNDINIPGWRCRRP